MYESNRIEFERQSGHTLVRFKTTIFVSTVSNDGILSLDFSSINDNHISQNLADLLKSCCDIKLGTQGKIHRKENGFDLRLTLSIRGSSIEERARQKYTEAYFTELLDSIEFPNLVQSYINSMMFNQLLKRIRRPYSKRIGDIHITWARDRDRENVSPEMKLLLKEEAKLQEKLAKIREDINSKISKLNTEQSLININNYESKIKDSCDSLSSDQKSEVLDILNQQKEILLKNR